MPTRWRASGQISAASLAETGRGDPTPDASSVSLGFPSGEDDGGRAPKSGEPALDESASRDGFLCMPLAMPASIFRNAGRAGPPTPNLLAELRLDLVLSGGLGRPLLVQAGGRGSRLIGEMGQTLRLASRKTQAKLPNEKRPQRINS